MQYLAIFFLIEQFLLGVIFIKFFDQKKFLTNIEKFAIAPILGIVGGFFIVLLASLISGKLGLGILIGSIIELILIIHQINYLIRFFRQIQSNIRDNWNLAAIKPVLFVLGLILPVVYVWYGVAMNALIFKDGELKGVLMGWGDIAYHFSMIQKFANSGNFTIDHPILSGAALTYPFLVNFASAVFLKLELGLFWAFHLPVIITGALGIVVLYLLALRIFKAPYFAALVLAFVLFGSGLGFLWFFEDAQIAYMSSGQSILETLNDPPHEYTHLDDRTGGKPKEFDAPQNIVWIVPVISFLSHQRSFAWGFALFAAFFLFLWLYREEKSVWKFGLILGLFPLVHGHTFIASSIAAAGFILWQEKNIKAWILFIVAALIAALPSIVYLNQGMKFLGEGAGKSFFRLQYGWMTCEHNTSWTSCLPREGTDASVLYFWSKNFGVIFWIWFAFIVLLIIRLLYLNLKKDKEKTEADDEKFAFWGWILIPSILLFMVPNILILQPWEFDNNKILFYWWILASFIAVGALEYFLSLDYFKNRIIKALAIFAVIVAAFLAMFSGLIDVRARLLNPEKNHFGYSGKADRDLAEWVIRETPPDSVFLTDASPTSPIATIAGRSLYLGYTGWLWSQGVNYTAREDKIRKILNNGDIGLACKEKIDYILINYGLVKAYPAAKFDLLKKMDIVYQDSANNIFLIKLNCIKL